MGHEEASSPQTGLFSDSHTRANLKALVLRGGAIKLTSQAIKLLLRIAGLLIMARLLMPQDFGIFAMMATVTGFLEMFNSTNLIIPTVQQTQISHAQVSVLFWVSATIGALLTATTAASGPLIAWFYGDPRLTRVALGIAPIFIVRGIAIQHQALLQRHLRLLALEMTSLVSQSAGAIAMIYAAWRGASYWSLVLNFLVMTTTETILLWVFSGWRPGLPRRGTGARRLLSFGGALSSYEVLFYAQRTIDKVLIGRAWGAQYVGLYVKAMGLITLSLTQLVNPIGHVVIPALSRLQTETERYRVYYFKTVGATLFLTMPLVALICVDARQIVLVALGSKWLAVVPIFLALAPAGGASTLAVMYTWACLSMGHGERISKTSFWVALGSTAAFLAGLPWGPVGVARAYSLAYCLMIIPILSYGLENSPIDLRDALAIAWRPATAAAAAALLALAIRQHLPPARMPIAQLLMDSTLFSVAYAGVWCCLPRGRDFLGELRASAWRAVRAG